MGTQDILDKIDIMLEQADRVERNKDVFGDSIGDEVKGIKTDLRDMYETLLVSSSDKVKETAKLLAKFEAKLNGIVDRSSLVDEYEFLTMVGDYDVTQLDKELHGDYGEQLKQIEELCIGLSCDTKNIRINDIITQSSSKLALPDLVRANNIKDYFNQKYNQHYDDKLVNAAFYSLACYLDSELDYYDGLAQGKRYLTSLLAGTTFSYIAKVFDNINEPSTLVSIIGTQLFKILDEKENNSLGSYPWDNIQYYLEGNLPRYTLSKAKLHKMEMIGTNKIDDMNISLVVLLQLLRYAISTKELDTLDEEINIASYKFVNERYRNEDISMYNSKEMRRLNILASLKTPFKLAKELVLSGEAMRDYVYRGRARMDRLDAEKLISEYTNKVLYDKEELENI